MLNDKMKLLEGFLQKIQSPTEKAAEIVLCHIIIFFMQINVLMNII